MSYDDADRATELIGKKSGGKFDPYAPPKKYICDDNSDDEFHEEIASMMLRHGHMMQVSVPYTG